jgi:hypothetical protein
MIAASNEQHESGAWAAIGEVAPLLAAGTKHLAGHLQHGRILSITAHRWIL